MKRCPKCGVEKSLDQFYGDRNKSGGRKPECKSCSTNMQRTYRQTQKGKTAHMKWKYGITLDEYDQIREQQFGVCAICGKPETAKYPDGTIRRLSVDHDHETGKVRGLLCSRCNQGIGLMEESTATLASAINYLIRAKS